MHKWRANSIRNTLLVYFVFFALTPVGLVVAYNYAHTNATLSQNYAENRMAVLSGAAEGVQARVAECQKFANLVYTNDAIQTLLAPSVDGHHPDYTLVRQAMDTFSQRIFDISSESYLLALLVVGENGLDLRYGHSTAFVNFDNIYASAWFQAGL